MKNIFTGLLVTLYIVFIFLYSGFLIYASTEALTDWNSWNRIINIFISSFLFFSIPLFFAISAFLGLVISLEIPWYFAFLIIAPSLCVSLFAGSIYGIYCLLLTSIEKIKVKFFKQKSNIIDIKPIPNKKDIESKLTQTKLEILKELFLSSKGRINRKTFIASLLFLSYLPAFILSLIGIITQTLDDIYFISTLFLISIFMIYPLLCIYTKRLHDLNQNAIIAWVVIAISLFSLYPPFNLIKFINLPIMLYLIIFKGNKNKNQYGQNPLKIAKYKDIDTKLFIATFVIFIISTILVNF